MARSRMLRPEFFTDKGLSRISVGARLLYLAIIPNMDRNGVTLGDPSILKGICFPCDAKLTIAAVRKWLGELQQLGRVIVFTYDETQYIMDPGFASHQNIYSNDPDVYRIPVVILDQLRRDWVETKSKQSLALLNQYQNLNLNQNADKKNQALGRGADAAPIPTTSNYDETTDAEILKLKAEIDARFAPQLQDLRDSQKSHWAGPTDGASE